MRSKIVVRHLYSFEHEIKYGIQTPENEPFDLRWSKIEKYFNQMRRTFSAISKTFHFDFKFYNLLWCVF